MENREIDKLIARHVFGYEFDETESDPWIAEGGYGYHGPVPHYSTSMVDAWPIVEKLSDYYDTRTMPYINGLRRGDILHWYMAYHGEHDVDVQLIAEWVENNRELGSVTAGNSMPLAICTVALQAIGCSMEVLGE